MQNLNNRERTQIYKALFYQEVNLKNSEKIRYEKKKAQNMNIIIEKSGRQFLQFQLRETKKQQETGSHIHKLLNRPEFLDWFGNKERWQ